MTQTATFQVFRGEANPEGGAPRATHGEAVSSGDSSKASHQTYGVDVTPGMVVLDAIHAIQRTQAPDLAVRWNCKAAKCGSCAAEVNGKPRLMCKTRLDSIDLSKPVVVTPLKAFPLVRDLVTDVSWNYEVNKTIQPFTPANEDVDSWRFSQDDADRAQEFRKCIECFMCQDVCHVLRNFQHKPTYAGPRWFVRLASLEMHPLDVADRVEYIKEKAGIGQCNITKCCTEVCPEDIHITDNAIIPLKERVVDRYYDPVQWLFRKFTGK